jgi:glycosyltransferase 2 family protein
VSLIVAVSNAFRRARLFALRSPIVRVAGTACAVALLLRSIDVEKAAGGLRDANVGWAVLGVILTALALVGSIFEWGVLVRGSGHRLSWRSLSSLYLQGLFVGQALPGGVGGDALRAVEVGRVTGHGNALASLAGSRMAGTLGMALWGVAGAVLLRTWLGAAGVAAACVFVVAMLVAWVLALGADKVVRGLAGHRSNWRQRAHKILHPFTGAFGGYRRRPRMLLVCLVVGAVGWGLNLCALAVFARSVGVDVSWTLFAVAIPVTLLATLVPFSLNGIGLREGVLVGLMAKAGVSTTHAGTLSILVDLQMIPFALLGALVWIRRARYTAVDPEPSDERHPVPALVPAPAAIPA